MQDASLGAPAALPSWSALCAGTPSGRRRAHRAGFTSPPGNQRAALALQGPFSSAGGQALWEAEGAQCSGAPEAAPSHPITQRKHPAYLEALRLGRPGARAGSAAQAPQEVADVQKVLVEAVIWAVGFQIDLEALAWQHDGRGVLVGLQHVLCKQRRGRWDRAGPEETPACHQAHQPAPPAHPCRYWGHRVQGPGEVSPPKRHSLHCCSPGGIYNEAQAASPPTSAPPPPALLGTQGPC